MQITFNPQFNKPIIPYSSKDMKFSVVSNNNANSYNLMSANAVYFRGSLLKSDNINGTNISKITSEKEYDEVLDRLKNDSSWSMYWKFAAQKSDLDKYEEGLLPYVGQDDISAFINTHMRGENYSSYRLMNGIPDNVLEDYIRVMDYALGKMDEKNGQYEGVVFRYGYFDGEAENFVSTAKNPEGMAHFIETSANPAEFPINIIYTKHGHQVEDISKKTNCVTVDESEVILDTNNYYQRIYQKTPEMENLKQEVLDSLKKIGVDVPDYISVQFYKEAE